MKAAFIGRFQPFHRGHRKVIEEKKDSYDEFYIVIGSKEKAGTEDNPLSFEERKKIIEACYPDIDIVGVKDREKNDEGNRKWLEEVKRKSEAEIIISGNPLVSKLVEDNNELELDQPDLHDPDVYSGTAIRRRAKSGEEWRYLVPSCAEEIIGKKIEKIKESGIKYDFEPGWEKKNAFYDTYEK